MSQEHAPERTAPGVRTIISKAELLAIIPLSYVTIWEQMRRDKFPRAIKLGDGPTAKSGWFLDEIQDYQEKLPRADLKPLTEAETKAAEAAQIEAPSPQDRPIEPEAKATKRDKQLANSPP